MALKQSVLMSKFTILRCKKLIHIYYELGRNKKKIYYVDDDYIRDVISFHLQDGAWDSIYKHISNNTLFHIKDDMNLEKNSDAIITIFFKDFPLLRWYLNNEKN